MSNVVEEEYRIHAEDLGGREREWRVSNISYQGVEEMAPVLHLDGTIKRLVLDAEQSRQMMTLTRTSIPEEWIGVKIRLAAAGSADRPSIVIASATAPRRRRGLRVNRIIIALLILAGAALLAWFAVLFGFTL